MQSEGGFEAVTRNDEWQKVVSKLGFEEEKSLCLVLCEYYEKILFPYDVFVSGATTASEVQIISTYRRHNLYLFLIANFQDVINIVMAVTRFEQLSIFLCC